MSARSTLYQNDTRTVFLIDIPTSIGEAQGINGNPAIGDILSSEPLSEPYTLANEPTVGHARPNLDQTAKAEIKPFIEQALKEIRQHHQIPWCKVRRTSTSVGSQEPSSDFLVSLGEDLQGVSKEPRVCNIDYYQDGSDSVSQDFDEDVSLPWESLFHNDNDATLTLRIPVTDGRSGRSDARDAVSYHIPARSTFLLSDCRNPSSLRNATRHLASEHDLPRHFDFIIMDPPWPNASAKRRKGYAVAQNLRETRNLLMSMDQDLYMKPGGYLAVWITNKAAVRKLVLGAGGLFENLNLTLVEEWIWVKVTAKGEPVTSLESTWRLPYETLLIARAPEDRLAAASPTGNVKRRVLAGVPDLHSRKPCLKSLVREVLFEDRDYDALEIFGRYLVAGWWTWGGEAVKYNWSGFWKPDPDG